MILLNKFMLNYKSVIFYKLLCTLIFISQNGRNIIAIWKGLYATSSPFQNVTMTFTNYENCHFRKNKKKTKRK